MRTRKRVYDEAVGAAYNDYDAARDTCRTCGVPSVDIGFHRIYVHFPGLEQIHRCPDIFVIHNFLSELECVALLYKIPDTLRRSAQTDEGGMPFFSALRTSEHCIVAQRVRRQRSQRV